MHHWLPLLAVEVSPVAGAVADDEDGVATLATVAGEAADDEDGVTTLATVAGEAAGAAFAGDGG